MGFRPGGKYKVRFSVPHPPPPAQPRPDSAGGGGGGPQFNIPICLATSESFSIVEAESSSVGLLTCTTPDMSAMLCDGSVLVEACEADGGRMLWTCDEVRRMLPSPSMAFHGLPWPSMALPDLP